MKARSVELILCYNSCNFGVIFITPLYMNRAKKPPIGFIGQGWIGKHYADDFERRSFPVVRYARRELYNGNREAIAKCDIVFIAVPTPTTPKGFDDSALREVLPLVGRGKTAVIKSTILPGSTKNLQRKNPGIFIMHSPEFLRETTAAHDAAHPDRNIIGIPKDTKEFRKRAKEVLAVLPKAPYELVCDSDDAELIKYAGNVFLYMKVIYANLLYDLSKKSGINFDTVRDAIAADPRIGSSHLNPIHRSGHGGISARGAGGHCFIKDFAAFAKLYEKKVGDALGVEVLRAIEEKNIALLKKSKKDLELLRGVYGDAI